ncbi:MAG TPA: winged helix DNA-binding protein [Sphingomonadaceae bacterium]|nr:winged helix DNA-binding protein [Sphingomonadaceae bacterium]
MAQAQFAYDDAFEAANDMERVRLAVSIFADRAHVRDEIREDTLAAGLHIVQCGDFAALLERDEIPLGEVILVDCPEVDAARLAALAWLDMRAARSAAQLVVATGIEALDDVFACLDQSHAQILVAPGRAERVVALGRTIGQAAQTRLRELSEDDRLQLIRLSEQVEAIAQKLDGLRLDRAHGGAGRPHTGGGGLEGGTLQVEVPGSAWHGDGTGDDAGERMRRTVRPALPDPRLVRQIIRQRQLRARFFDADLFADPAWDILLDLTAARAEHKRVSVTSLCIASGVPPTTALRWIGQMTESGLLVRVEDEADRRRAFIALSDKAADGMARYFSELGVASAHLS